MIVAHEWGHAIQNRAGIFQLPTIVLEQQADCFAGSWMAHVAVDNTLFSVNDETLNVAFSGMLTFRDSPGTTADLEGAHGSGFDRVGAFQDGYTNTASQCATYEREPPPVIELPFTTADIDNGGNLPFDQIVPLSAQDLDLYWKDLFASLGATYSAPAGGLQPYPTNGPYPSCSSLAPDADFATGRVWYCPDNDFIAYDQDALAGPVYEIGDFAASVLIGNAWSDAMLTKLHVNLSGKERSLTNDCLTGTWTRSTLPDQQTNPDRLVLSAGDLDEGVTAFLRYGAGEHGERTEEVGTVFERTASFRKGILQGVSACGIGR
jgi:predicted metalloprotease